ncbi:MAG: hypothetical protein PUP91_04970 [Rhizonema sp. PD37]|nr:hypothetical protein [Rhizonema sp. PD37]
MTLLLNPTPELEAYLAKEARRQGLTVEALALQVLKQHALFKDKQTQLVNVLQTWLDDDDIQEQQQTGEYLIQALDEDRLSKRKLFPTELRGVTW